MCAPAHVHPVFEWTATDAGIRVVGGEQSMLVEAPDWRSVGSGPSLHRPADAALSGSATRLRVPATDATVLGVQVQEQVDVSAGQETIVGVNRDPQFGPLVMLGLGGVFVQVFRDTTVRVAPVSEAEARTMTGEIRAAPLLRGARGRPELAVDGVVETIQRVSQLAVDFPAIRELDVNPLVVLEDGVSAVDFRVALDFADE